MNIFIIRNGSELGPYTAEEINRQLKAGVFSAADVAKYEGSVALWPLGAVPGVCCPRATTDPHPSSFAPASHQTVSFAGKRNSEFRPLAVLAAVVAIIVVAGVVFSLYASYQPQWTVDRWLDQCTAGDEPYDVKGVSGYELVNHKILKSNHGVVTSELTFKNRRGGDIVETHTFSINEDGKIEMLR